MSERQCGAGNEDYPGLRCNRSTGHPGNHCDSGAAWSTPAQRAGDLVNRVIDGEPVEQINAEIRAASPATTLEAPEVPDRTCRHCGGNGCEECDHMGHVAGERAGGWTEEQVEAGARAIAKAQDPRARWDEHWSETSRELFRRYARAVLDSL